MTRRLEHTPSPDDPGFTHAQRTFLTETLRLTPLGQADETAMTVRDLCDPAQCARALDALAPRIGAPSRRVAASLLGKRLSFLLTGACLYALSACNRALVVSPDSCLIELSHDGTRWVSSLPLTDTHGTPLPGEAERGPARDRVIERLFTEVIAPLWQSFHEASGVPPRMLWENTAVRVYSLYERRLDQLTDPADRARCKADFDRLLTAPAALFGAPFNPIARFHHAPVTLCDGQKQRYRKTCCLYFQATHPAEYCQSCPLLKPLSA
ncbi:IucA/IucC family C-terminal-domain containing protein [Larsenimonas salina]|uniref:IucA/IucC family C-terminal-domain containing protein n=1 Tax=Larsenimonas salina TaxID=1295565 RepID=UPI0020736F42|nr:(2Fe-2S)-binding protein [Larsenimonas salina]